MTVAVLDAERVLAPAARTAESWFRDCTGAAGIRADWAVALTVGDAALVGETLAAVQASDLAIFGQHDPHRPDIRVPAELVEEVILHSGRPVLIVPHTGAIRHLGRRVMIAWNGGREATRALNDALPLLERAEAVTLVAINVEGETRGMTMPCSSPSAGTWRRTAFASRPTGWWSRTSVPWTCCWVG